MKTKFYFISLFCCIALFSFAEAQYYYSDGRQVPLFIDSTKVLVLFDDDWPYNFNEFEINYPRVDSIESMATIDDFQIIALNESENLDNFIDSLRADYRVRLANPFYTNDIDSSILIGRTICCKFAEYVSYGFIDSLNAEYNVEVLHENEITPKLFLLRVIDDAQHSLLEIANIYYELPETDFCHPNFLGGFEWNDYNIYDHYWIEQWAMHRIFNTSPTSPDSLNHKAFQLTTGDSDVIVAVIDQGVAPHEAIPAAKIVNGYDFANMDDNPCPCQFPTFCGHGESVAGIIGAAHNRNQEAMADRIRAYME